MIKKIITLVLVLAPLSLCAQKFAHYSNVDVIQAMPAYRTAMTELQNVGKQYEQDLQPCAQRSRLRLKNIRRK